MKLFRIAAPLAMAGMLVFSSAQAQQPHTMPQQQKGSMAMDVDKMMADMKASDVRLEALTATMKAAKGEEKVLAMQNVVSELVTNQVAMHRHMSMMHERMTMPMPQK